jgi:hypothetical protein
MRVTRVWPPNEVATVGTTILQVNKALKAKGYKDELVKGKGLFFFYGDDASNWPDNTVHVNNVKDLSLEQWLSQYERLKMEADPDLQARLNEERYGNKTKRNPPPNQPRPPAPPLPPRP